MSGGAVAHLEGTGPDAVSTNYFEERGHEDTPALGARCPQEG